MPKKKDRKKNVSSDFTINDCANASKPVGRGKKSATMKTEVCDLSWDQIENEDFDIVEEVNEDGIKELVCKKKRSHSKSEDNIDQRPGILYPEILWYWISRYICPEDIGRFAGINKATYAITKNESFWKLIYKRYCQKHPKLPERLCIENSYKAYGLRQRVIRSLYHTYDVFIAKVAQEAIHDSRPHQLVKRRCINVWFYKGVPYWSVYFKFKKRRPWEKTGDVDFLEELGRIDANPEEDAQVLQVTCQNFCEVPPLMGMTLTSVSVVLSQGLRHHRLHLGFTTGVYVSKDILPECTVVLDTVVNIFVYDWWHPKYPHFENKLPIYLNDEESAPVLKRNFFTIRDSEL